MRSGLLLALIVLCVACAPAADKPPTPRPLPASGSESVVKMANGDFCDVVRQKETMTAQVFFIECERADGERYEPELGVLETTNPLIAILGPLSQLLPFLAAL